MRYLYNIISNTKVTDNDRPATESQSFLKDSKKLMRSVGTFVINLNHKSLSVKTRDSTPGLPAK